MPLSDFSGDGANRPSHFHVSESMAKNDRNSEIWDTIFSSNQGQNESVSQYGDRIIALVDQLTDIPWDLHGPMVFYRVKAGLLDPIKEALSMQIIQPTSHAALNEVAIVIERNLGRRRPSSSRMLLDNSAQQHATPDDYGYTEQTVREQYEHDDYDEQKEEPVQMLGRYPVDRPSEGIQGVKRRADYQGSSTSNPEIGKPSGLVSEGEKKRRKEESCCYECGRHGHMAGQCPDKQMRQGAEDSERAPKRQKRWQAPNNNKRRL